MKMKINGSRAGMSPKLWAMIVLAAAGIAFFLNSEIRDSARAQTTIAVVNAASFNGDENRAFAPETIVAVFGVFVTQNNQTYIADTLPLPTSLGGVSVTINSIPSGLFFTSTGQINLMIPPNVQDGVANIVITNSDGTMRNGTITIERAAPGLFSARANGQGAAAALTTTDGVVYNTVFNPDGSEKEVSAGTTQQPNILVLYGTGLRYTPAATPGDENGVAEAVTVTIQGVQATVQYAGPAAGFAGLDQINVVIPPELSGFGSLRIVLTANGRVSNEVTILIGGELPPVRLTNITVGQEVMGTLDFADQVQGGSGGSTYFFDAYSFNIAAANTPVAIDLRSTQFDAGVLLYKVENNALNLIAADDQTGGYGNGQVDNNNALLLTVLQTPGQYVIFASSSDFDPNGVGNYTLKVTTNVALQIAYGQNIANGAITGADLQTSAGTYLDVYWFNGVSGETAQIDMGSMAFDSFLILQRNDGDPPIANDDNSGGGNNSRITFQLPATGIYIVLATPFAPNVTGAYTLSLTKTGGFAPEIENPILRHLRPSRQIVDPRGRQDGISSFERASRRRIIIQ
ncbi:MAG: hypothetical protein IPM66_04835 [Acidobacteriota bacterium]|nr:MAG: hypothetical protein IPM66_04835 [Acidobacteriota bacterium]